MRFFILTMSLIILSGCASSEAEKEFIKKEDIEVFMAKKEILGTPRDNLISGELLCFSDYDHDNDYNIENIAAFQFEHGESFNYDNFYHWNDELTHKESLPDSEDYNESDKIDGVLVQISLLEDDNGEFYADVYLDKRTLIKEKKIANKKEDVFKYIAYNKTYYPKNKLPHRYFEDKEEVCYITLSW